MKRQRVSVKKHVESTQSQLARKGSSKNLRGKTPISRSKGRKQVLEYKSNKISNFKDD